MAIGASAVWRVRTGGNAANGGFYTSGGTDYSQQDAAQLSVTDGVTIGTATVTSATGGFTAAMIGNGINIAGVFYEIATRVDANTITVDRNTGTATGQTMKVGGAHATLITPVANLVLGNIIDVQNGSYTQSANATATVASGFAFYMTNNLRIQGNGATIQAASSCTKMLDLTAGWWVEDLILDCNNVADDGIDHAGYGSIARVQVKGFKVNGFKIYSAGFVSCLDCEANDGKSGCTAGFNFGTIGTAHRCKSHDNLGHGFLFANNACAGTENEATNNLLDGINSSYSATLKNNVCHANGRDGIRLESFVMGDSVTDNIITSNGAYGIKYNGGAGTVPQTVNVDYNAFRSNTSGALSALTAGAHDVTLSGDPYTNAAGNDYTTNNTAGAGAACRAAGSQSNKDIGRYQHADAGGSAGMLYVPNLGGT